ncbi:tetratricopeptide repeat protein [Aestuariibaculum sediminum]|uniref:HTH luxR-type domain-containing protein n=1 Tax=Aestuariibaculum sediminum TaxID=2770637 RepID=A0A8J6Q3Q9_9FLAO|nr:hypothetical protein [Aestuariibaculum sediminum]MBD0832600.1 hypothetical protein [Aestuariibaculum sediminum]
MNIYRHILFFLSFIFVISCQNEKIIENTFDNHIELSNELKNAIRNIKKIEYSNVNLLTTAAKNLNKIDDKYARIYSKFYQNKAEFLKESNPESLHSFDSIYDELKEKKLYKLMAEIDILSAYTNHRYDNYTKVEEHVRKSFEYCFSNDMELERYALVYGISATAIANSPKEKKEEILSILEDLNKYKWTYYHSRVYENLAYAYTHLKDFEEANRIMSVCLENNTNNGFLYELANNYEVYALIQKLLHDDSSLYIKNFLKSIEARKSFGMHNLSLAYRLIGHQYFEIGNFQKAVEYYLKTVESDKENQDSLAEDYAYAGWAYFQLDHDNNFKKADAYLDKSLSLSEKGSIDYEMALERKIWIRQILNKTQEVEQLRLLMLQSRNLTTRNLNNQALKDLKTNTLLELKSKNYRLATLEMNEKISKNKLSFQRIFNFGLVILLIILLLFLLQIRKNLKNYKVIKTLNQKLQKSVKEIENQNNSLNEKNNEITKLLEHNERTLFARVLKISTYKDAIDNLIKDISKTIDTSTAVPVKEVINIQKQLKSIITEDEIWEDFKFQFEKTRPGFLKKLNDVAPNLSVNDIKHCTYLLLNLKTKEVAQLINITPRSVETARYRLKRKLGLQNDDNLFQYLNSL